MPSALGRGIDTALQSLDLSQQVPLPGNIPLKPEEFYPSFGYLKHPATREPVRALADYQYDGWRKFLKHGRILEVKSHRVGESSKWMLVDFQLAVLPSSHKISTRGYDTMLLAPTKPQAIEILRDFRRRALESKRYSPFILDKPAEIDEYGSLSTKAILRDEKSKTEAIYIKNPEDPIRPSRIIALGAGNPGSLESWPNFKHLHITDITASRKDYKEALEIALTRIANTDGTVVIETIPGKPYGSIYDWAQRYRGIPESELQKGDFCYVEVTAEQAVAAGVMPKDFLEGERRRLTASDFNALYMAHFGGTTGNVFKSADIERAIELGKKYDPESIRSTAEKSQGIDEGFGSSMFGVCVVQKVDGILQVASASINCESPLPKAILATLKAVVIDRTLLAMLPTIDMTLPVVCKVLLESSHARSLSLTILDCALTCVPSSFISLPRSLVTGLPAFSSWLISLRRALTPSAPNC